MASPSPFNRSSWSSSSLLLQELAFTGGRWQPRGAIRVILDQELAQVRAAALERNEDAKRWNREAQNALQGLGQAIDRQFDRWGLTPAEREVALLQLKGLRHKAIAELRNTSERTVRQQALTVYRKSGLNGRSDLAAFFLEDLFVPAERHSEAASLPTFGTSRS